MNRFDFAIAPLDIKNPLNKAKSALKYLEYSALGLPGIYSSIDPYTENVENGKTGMIVPDNSITSWCAAFAQLSLDREVRKTISNNARCDVRARHMLQNHFDEWVMLIESE